MSSTSCTSALAESGCRAEGWLYAGVEIGGTKLQVGVGRADGQLLRSWRCDARPSGGAAAIREDIFRLLDGALDEVASGAGVAMRGIGVGFGGPVDAAGGRTVIRHQVAGWEDYPLAEELSRRYGLAVRVENDASTAGLAEARCGAGRGARRVFYVTVGSGIGGGWVIDGRIDGGQGLGSAEIGHTVQLDEAGELRRLEDLASGWAIQEWARRRLGEPEGEALRAELRGDETRLTTRLLAERAGRGDALATAALGRGAWFLGIALANVISLLDPEVIVIGGGVGQAGWPFFDPLRATVARHAFHLYRHHFRLVPAALGESVVLVGALLVAAG